ncbi:MAG TPA: protein kinase [Candidatus Binatia bacterium]|nr:protein kinase [Candidatus Binatia bacterium]
MALTSGTRIGGYEIAGALGAGGMGEVYRARDTRLDRTVAIKALPDTFAKDPARLARFEREAKLLASLNHPNIAGIHGIVDADGVPYLVLEFVAGETLGSRLARGALSLEETLPAAVQIASAVEAAHERGVVHRDLKPGNVMITPAGVVKVLDFGIAKDRSALPSSSSVAGTEPITAEGAVLGTTAYMSPEQARGQAVDHRTDIWAFGCILFECLSGSRPFPGATGSDVIAKVLEREPEWSAIPSGTPARLRDLLKRCLVKDPSARAGAIGALRKELAEMADGSRAPRSGQAAAIPSLAVLYFENLSSDRDSDYFCAGITEDILTDLSKIRGLRVASRNAVAKFRGESVDIPRVAADLGVTAVVEGSVRRSGDRVRISAQLINAADGFHLWAERYDRTLQDVFAVQEEIASSIVAALKVALAPGESENLLRDRPGDVRAYDLYLKGRELYYRYTEESLREALGLFERATQMEPEYALAWAGIADCYGQMLQWGLGTRTRDLVRMGLEAARRSIALDPNLAEGYKAESLVMRSSGDIEGARQKLVRALEINPRLTSAWINLAVHAFEACDVAGAERGQRRAMQTDPQSSFASTWLSTIFRESGRYDDAIEAALRSIRFSGNVFDLRGSYSALVCVHLRRNDLPAARKSLAEARAAAGMGPNFQVLEANIAVRAGLKDEALRLLSVAESSLELQPHAILCAIEVSLALDDMDRALGFARRPIFADISPALLRLNPRLHPLLDHEPFTPRVAPATLVWPREAPPVDPAIAGLFAGVRVESGLPTGTGSSAAGL